MKTIPRANPPVRSAASLLRRVLRSEMLQHESGVRRFSYICLLCCGFFIFIFARFQDILPASLLTLWITGPLLAPVAHDLQNHEEQTQYKDKTEAHFMRQSQ